MKKFSSSILALVLFATLSIKTNAQSVGIGAGAFAPDTKSILELQGNGLGMLIPRMLWANRPTPVALAQDGLMIYCTDGDGTNGKGFYYWDGTSLSWKKLFGGATGDYILNQNAIDQAADFRITGDGRFGGDISVNGGAIFGPGINGGSNGMIWMISNTDVRLRLDLDNNGSNYFYVFDGLGSSVFSVSEAGYVNAFGDGTFGGAGSFNGNLTILGDSRIISSGNALSVRSNSGLTLDIDYDNTGPSSVFTVQKDAGALTLFSLAEDNNAIFYPYGTAAGNTGGVKFRELAANGTDWVGLRAPDLLGGTYMFTLPISYGTSGQVLTGNGAGTFSWTTPTVGTVTSVGLSLPSIFTVSNSPVTTSGTLTGTLASQTANTVFAAPNGSAGTPIFRALAAADLPGSFSGFANPTASIVLTAVNGSATTAMRSDAAPALSQAIVPTWTGTHTFSNATYSALFTGGNVGIGTASPTKKLEVNGDIYNKGILFQKTSDGQGSGAHGISWYDPAFVTWYDYMAPNGGTNAPSGTAAPTDAASNVITWARRFNIENVAGYGWAFESGPNTSGVAPTVKFAISSNTGTFHSIGNGYIDGYVGIGTSSPGTKLDVVGSIRTSNQLISTVVTGTAPIAVSSTTINTNLNADLTDGLHAGNANGQIPVSNATLNTNLNSDMVDGLHASSFLSSASGTINYISKFTSANAIGNSQIFDNGTNVGIGTSGPAIKLEVRSDGLGTWQGRMGLSNATSDKQVFFGNYGSIAGVFAHNFALNAWADLYLNTVTGTTGMVVKGDGNVGIGTTSPGTKLDVVGGAIRTNNQLISTVATGTAPLAVSSTTINTNLNADMTDGYHANAGIVGNNIVVRDVNGYIFGNYINTTDNSVASGVTGIMVKQGDNYYRTGTAAAVATFLNATGTWIPNNGIGDWQIASSSTGTSYSLASLELRESNWTGNGSATPPRLGFNWGGVVASQIGIESSGRIAILNNPGTGYENLIANNLYAGSNLYFSPANPTISAPSYFVAPGGAYFNSGIVYTEAQYQCRGGIHNDNAANLTIAGGTSGTTYFSGAISGMSGYYPANNMIRLTPNLHLNSSAGNAVILNWDNGTTGATQTFRIGNGAGSDVFDVLANGNTGIGIGAPTFKLHVIGSTAANKATASFYPATTAVGSSYHYNSTYAGDLGYSYASLRTGGSVSAYQFGVVGQKDQNYDGAYYYDYRSGGVLGTLWYSGSGNYLMGWGSLGYFNSGGSTYGCYYTSVGSGAGYMQDNGVLTGIGSGGYGGVMGGWSRGEVLGFTSAGELYASYNLGNEYTSGVSADIVSNNDERLPAYSVTSNEVKVYSDGKAQLVNGYCKVTFEKSFMGLLSAEKTPTVTVSALGESEGIFISSIDKDGFIVKESHSGQSNIEFTWIAIGTRLDANTVNTLPDALKDKDFDNNMKGVMFNENNKEQSATPIWWDGTKLRFDTPPKSNNFKNEEIQNPVNNDPNDPTKLWKEQQEKMIQQEPDINAPVKSEWDKSSKLQKEQQATPPDQLRGSLLPVENENITPDNPEMEQQKNQNNPSTLPPKQ